MARCEKEIYSGHNGTVPRSRAKYKGPHMKALLLCLLIAILCSLSFLAARRTTAEERFAAHVSHETNELDRLQPDIAAQK